MADNSTRPRVDAQLRKELQAKEGKAAMAEYEANILATRVKTERLRALRLAREAAAPPPAPAKTKTVKKTKKPATKLSNWLDEQQKSGRNT